MKLMQPGILQKLKIESEFTCQILARTQNIQIFLLSCISESYNFLRFIKDLVIQNIHITYKL